MALSLALDLVGGPVFDGLSASAGVINEIKQYNVELGLSTIEIMLLSTKMDNGRALVDRLSRIKFRLLNFFCCCTSNCANQLRELNRELGSLFDTLRLEQIRDVKEIMKLQRQNRDDLDEIKVMVQKILQVIDHPELKGLLNKLGGSMETSTSTSTSTLSSASASGSNTEVGVTQATSFEGLVQEAFRLLINVVEEVKESSMMFKPLLLRLKSTLDCLRPFIEEMVQDNKVLDHPEEELEKLRIQMENGVNLIRKCSSVCRWTSNKKDKYTKQVFELDEFLKGSKHTDSESGKGCEGNLGIDKEYKGGGQKN
ncbi:hypothetical protein M0R45_004394 [Rubus argutus]|uniref:RPW8 domain-containing protein n=1 Tax=Rubus argutus TaxID=59490 RepID=A0AAW1YJM5_RUBAR